MRILLRIILVMVIAWPAIAVSLKSDGAVYRFVEYYVPNWIIGALMLRIIAMLFFTLAILIAFNRAEHFSKALSILVLIPISDNLAFLFGYDRFQTLFLFSNSMFESVFQVVLFSISFVLIVKMKYPLQAKRWVYFIAVFGGLSLSFIKPVYIDDWEHPETNSPLEYIELKTFAANHKLSNPDDQPILLAFFTTSCPFCALTAIELGINNRNNKLPQSIIVFPGTKEDAEAFLSGALVEDLTYILVDRETFLKYAGHTFPSLYYLNANQAHHYTGSNFGYRALEFIAK